MVQIFIVAYLVIGLVAALLIWAVLIAAKRAPNESLEYKSLEKYEFVETKTESISSYSS